MGSLPKPIRDIGGIIVEPARLMGKVPVWCRDFPDLTSDDLIVYDFGVLWAPRSMQRSDPLTPITSPPFPIGHRWLTANLVFYPQGLHGNDWTAISLKVDKKNKHRLAACLRAFYTEEDLFDCGRCRWFAAKTNGETTHLSTTASTYDPEVGWRFDSFYNRTDGKLQNFNELFFQIRIQCAVEASTSAHLTKICSAAKRPRLSLEEPAPDVVLEAGDTKLKAHKAVLSERSSVFKTMLEADMSEGRSGVVKLKGVSAAAASALLDFFYGRDISLLRAVEPAIELLNAANMFDVPELKTKCLGALISFISVATAPQILEAGCMYDLPELTWAAMDCINKNKAAVTSTPQWEEMLSRNSKLIVQALLGI